MSFGAGSSKGGYVDVEKVDGRDAKEWDRAVIFPPMHLLPSRMTVTDLKLNQLTPLAVVGLPAIVQQATNGVLAAAGSTYGIDLTTVETFRDVLQYVRSLLL